MPFAPIPDYPRVSVSSAVNYYSFRGKKCQCEALPPPPPGKSDTISQALDVGASPRYSQHTEPVGCCSHTRAALQRETIRPGLYEHTVRRAVGVFGERGVLRGGPG